MPGMLKEKGDRHMYLIKLETALPITEKQKNLLCGCVAEADRRNAVWKARNVKSGAAAGRKNWHFSQA